MKNVFLLLAIFLVVSCTPKETASKEESETKTEERAIGFNTVIPENKWHLGTEEAIQVVKELDKVWVERDYEAMKSFFADTAMVYFPDGRIAKSPDEFVDFLKADDEGSEDTWTFDYAFSVDLDPATGGEHVQAGFTGTSVKDGVTEMNRYHEWYYVIEGKIVTFRQFKQDIKEME